MSGIRKSTTGNKDLLLRDRWLSCTKKEARSLTGSCVCVCVFVLYSLYINLSSDQSKNASFTEQLVPFLWGVTHSLLSNERRK